MLTRLALLLGLGLASGCSSAGTSESCVPLDSVGGLGGDGGAGGGEEAPPASGGSSSSLCCRVCSAGKACGDSCINRNLTCDQPVGCACNG
jgi:hypothetical protein